jgi:hypothetical protein
VTIFKFVSISPFTLPLSLSLSFSLSLFSADLRLNCQGRQIRRISKSTRSYHYHHQYLSIKHAISSKMALETVKHTRTTRHYYTISIFRRAVCRPFRKAHQRFLATFAASALHGEVRLRSHLMKTSNRNNWPIIVSSVESKRI